MYGSSRFRVQSWSYKSRKTRCTKTKQGKGASEKLITTVLFPHKLFQEYLAGLYLAALYDSSQSEFDRMIDETVLPRAKEFRYVLYFTVLKGRNQSTNIMQKLLKLTKASTPTGEQSLYGSRRHHDGGGDSKDIDTNFVVDVAFESQDDETAAIVNKHLQSDDKQDLTINEDEPSKSTHTVFGYLFIRKQLVSYSNFTHESIVSITYPHLHMRD